MSTILSGFLVGLGLIVAIGAQNAWVLARCIRGEYPYLIAAVCASVDAILMATGVLILEQMQQWLPSIVPWMTLAGVTLLVWLALQSFNRAWHQQQGLVAAVDEPLISAASVIGRALMISLLNPHVYLDTVILVGGLASVQVQPWLFWAGAAAASVLWFFGLAALGRPLRRWLSSVRRWQLFEVLIGFLMLWVAWGLVKLYLSGA